MTNEVICKACGEEMDDDVENYEAGDSIECPECGTGYDFKENPKNQDLEDVVSDELLDEADEDDIESLEDAMLDVDLPPLMVTDHSTVPDREEPGVEEVEEAADGVVTYRREDGTRVRDYVEDFPGDLEEYGVDPAEAGADAAEPEVTTE